MNRPLTPDQRAGLSVTGLLLVVVAFAIGLTGYHLYGVPQWPMASTELLYAIGAGACGVIGFGCLYKGTDVTG